MISNKQRSLYVVIILIVIACLGYLTYKTISAPSPLDIIEDDVTENTDSLDESVDTSMIVDDPIENELIRALLAEEYSHEADLKDVTDQQVIREVNTNGDATGVAKMDYSLSHGYQLLAEFEGLPDPAGEDFYEGWVVRKEPFAFISTGKLDMVGGKIYNGYESMEDYSDYTQYVLTLEPNDGDPSPADHILEGEFEEVVFVK